MSLAQKLVAMGMVLLIVLGVFLFSPILGIVGLFVTVPLALAILRL